MTDDTHFGYERVGTAEKTRRVGSVFRSVAPQYDKMNDLMSMGIHRIWKRFTLELAGVRPGQQVLDLAGGTGDLALHLSRQVGDHGRVVLADINEAMLDAGRDRLLDSGAAHNIELAQVDAETLPFPDNHFDCVTMAFGLRNVTNKDQALAEIERVLKPGGRVLILEFSRPTNTPLERLYDLYSFSVLPRLGRAVAGDAESYRYLAESIRMHPDQSTLKTMMESAGLTAVEYFNMTGGIVALHRGYKA